MSEFSRYALAELMQATKRIRPPNAEVPSHD